jgi:hypothetical protein
MRPLRIQAARRDIMNFDYEATRVLHIRIPRFLSIEVQRLTITQDGKRGKPAFCIYWKRPHRPAKYRWLRRGSPIHQADRPGRFKDTA